MRDDTTRAVPTAPEELAATLDESQPLEADHVGPGWPLASSSHCAACRDRKTAGWQLLYPPGGSAAPTARLRVTTAPLTTLPHHA